MAGCLGVLLQLAAAEPPLAIEAGTTREEVIRIYGPPSGESKLGTREILNYPHGQVSLENGRVVIPEFATKSSTPTSERGAADRWQTDFEVAAREAVRRNVNIMALFTGPEGSEASRRFVEEVALHPEFLRFFSADHVFLRIDFPGRASASTRLEAQHEQLRARHRVISFPTVLILTRSGERLAAADFTKSPSPGSLSLRLEAIATLREIRAKLALGGEEPPPVAVEAKSPAKPLALYEGWLTPFALSVGLRSAEALIGVALVCGGVIAVVLVWLLWRDWVRRHPDRASTHAERISTAASGVPTLPDTLTWSKQQVCAVTILLAEVEGFEAAAVPGGGRGKDLLLTRRGEMLASVAVGCSPARAGIVTAKSLRKLQSAIEAEGIQFGWYVAPAGFSNDALAYAAQQKLVLIDGAHLLARLHDWPHFMLMKLPLSRRT